MTDIETTRRSNQRLIVINQFREAGRVDAHVMWTRYGISRTAAIVCLLRKDWGEDSIVTVRETGEMAVYILKRPPEMWVKPRARRAKRIVKGWYCATCGQRTMSQLDTRLTSTAGKSMCGTCRKVTMFWLR